MLTEFSNRLSFQLMSKMPWALLQDKDLLWRRNLLKCSCNIWDKVKLSKKIFCSPFQISLKILITPSTEVLTCFHGGWKAKTKRVLLPQLSYDTGKSSIIVGQWNSTRIFTLCPFDRLLNQQIISHFPGNTELKCCMWEF